MSNQEIGIVVIGRNEGLRLAVCLESILSVSNSIIYVDSGSTDNSIELVKSYDVSTHQLNANLPFTAARARNEGFEKLLETNPNLTYVQFIDADCELAKHWITQGLDFLKQRSEYAIVCGRRREKYADSNIYSTLCDIEWNAPVGDVFACGGDFICRVDVFKKVNGFDGGVIAGEEPEMCYRIRELGYKIRRIDCDMTIHDANIDSINKFLVRTQRGGYATALWFYRYGLKHERFKLREFIRIILWGVVFPLLLVFLLFINQKLLLLILVLSLMQVVRITSRVNSEYSIKPRLVYALFMLYAKPIEFAGVLAFFKEQCSKQKKSIYEYK